MEFPLRCLLSTVLGRGTRRIHFVTGLYLSALALTITAISIADATRFRFLPDPNINLAMIGLVLGTLFAVAARLERAWVPIAIAPFGIIATLASALYRVSNNSSHFGECAIAYVSWGFPLAWNSTYEYFGRCTLLPLPYLSPNRFLVFFSTDVVFYVAVGVGLIQLFRATTGRTTIPPVFPIGSNGKDNHPRKGHATR